MMIVTKTPPSLPTELWINILEHNNYNPLDLLRLQKIREIKKKENTFSKISKYMKSYIHSGMPVSGSVTTIKSAFLAPLASAASSNSFMRNYSPKNIANGCLLDAFSERLKKMDHTTRQQIIANYLGKGDKIDFSSARINDFDLAMSFVTTTPFKGQYGFLCFVSTELLNEKAVILAAVGQTGKVLQYVSAESKSDKEIVWAAVGQDGWALKHASAELKNDKSVVLAAVGQKGAALAYASAELQNNKEVVLAAVGQDGWALAYASAELKNDKSVVLAAVRQNGTALQFANAELKNKREFILIVLRQIGWALSYASTELKNDKEVVLTAVGQSGFALEYASAELKNDEEVVFAAARQDRRALRYAGTELKIEVILAAERQAGGPLEYSCGG